MFDSYGQIDLIFVYLVIPVRKKLGVCALVRHRQQLGLYIMKG